MLIYKTAMTIEISDNREIVTIQKEFSEKFPYLNLVFFSKPHASGMGSSKKIMVSNSHTLKECRRKHNTGNIEITPEMTVNELEGKFWADFGLSIQVFRKSGSSWLETTATDKWTLEKQNQMGHDITNFNRREETEEFDNDRTK